MGIPHMNKLLDRSHLSELRRLKNQKLVMDLSKPYWFVKKFIRQNQYDKHTQDINRFGLKDSDRYGGNVIELDHLFREFFLLLKNANIKPIIVYGGTNPTESESILGSKVVYMKKSCQIAMLMNSRPSQRNHITIPNLIVGVIKRIINEFGFDEQVVHSAYEVYPMLLHLATQHDCEVLTNHADFIMLNARKGFFQWQDIQMSLNNEKELLVNVQSHRKLIQQFHITNTGGSLSTLLTLMRQDFQGIYHNELNDLFQLKNRLSYNDGRFRDRARGERPLFQGRDYERLLEILDKWNKLNFIQPSDVRKKLLSYSNSSLIRDFDVVHRTFNEPLRLESEQLIPPTITNQFDIMESLSKRESSADFLLDVMCGRKIFYTIGLEDMSTILSTFSLGNAARELVMVESQVRDLSLFDRIKQSLSWQNITQSLQPDAFRQIPNDQLIYSHVFRFPVELLDENCLRQWIETHKRRTEFATARVLDLDTCKELVVVMLLIRYGFEFGFRKRSRLSISKEGLGLERKSSSSSSSSQSQEVADPSSLSYQTMKILLQRAVYNCFMYYTCTGVSHIPNSKPDPRISNRTLVTDQLLESRNFFPNLNILSTELMSPKVQKCITFGGDNYLPTKHCIEILNSTLHAYCELNSLFNYPATRLNYNRWYNGQLIHKIMRFEREHTKAEFVMNLDQDLMDLINTPF